VTASAHPTTLTAVRRVALIRKFTALRLAVLMRARAQVIEMVSRVAPGMKAPLVLFTYYNPIIRRGMDNFCKTIKEAGASGAVPAGAARLATMAGLQQGAAAQLFSGVVGAQCVGRTAAVCTVVCSSACLWCGC
jgi:hypothetical protein